MTDESAYPESKRIQSAILAALQNLGGEAKLNQVVQRLTEVFADELTPGALAATENNRPNSSRWNWKIRTAKESLKVEGLLFAPSEVGRNLWKLTPLGVAKVLADSGDMVSSEGDEAFPSTAQGFALSATARMAIELHAVRAAIKYFEDLGYVVETRGKAIRSSLRQEVGEALCRS